MPMAMSPALLEAVNENKGRNPLLAEPLVQQKHLCRLQLPGFVRV